MGTEVAEEVIGSGVGSRAWRFGGGFGPHAVAVGAIELPLDEPQLGEEADGQVSEQGFLSELRIVNVERAAVGAMNGVA